MGSLPNLADLARDALDAPRPNSLQGADPALADAEKSRVLHRHSRYDKRPAGYEVPSKRRDSPASSIGANSVRRLIAVVRGTNGKAGPVYTKRVLVKNLVLLCVSNLCLNCSFFPFLGLQSSVTVWFETDFPVDVNVGGFLLAVLFLLGSVSAMLSPFYLRKFSHQSILTLTYFITILFYASHFYPVLYILLPSYLIFGLFYGPLIVTNSSFLLTISTKLSYIHTDDDEETKFNRKICLLRRLSRLFRFSHDSGIIIGSILSALIINFGVDSLDPDAIFDQDSYGDRICGADSCPSRYAISNGSNATSIPRETGVFLAGSYAACACLGWIPILFLDRIRAYVYQDPLERSASAAVVQVLRDSRMRVSILMGVFVGLEQSFILSDFGKSYVACTLGVHRLNWVFLCMGLLESVAAVTLSMLMRSVRRYYLIGVGFAFHCCLLLVQTLWKPMNDDPALFYVISAAWGVCNAIWEMLNYTFVTDRYSEEGSEAAFGASTASRLLGLSVGFAAHGLLCDRAKIYVLGVALATAAAPDAWLEARLEGLGPRSAGL